jgi:hypothetical protein
VHPFIHNGFKPALNCNVQLAIYSPMGGRGAKRARILLTSIDSVVNFYAPLFIFYLFSLSLSLSLSSEQIYSHCCMGVRYSFAVTGPVKNRTPVLELNTRGMKLGLFRSRKNRTFPGTASPTLHKFHSLVQGEISVNGSELY